MDELASYSCIHLVGCSLHHFWLDYWTRDSTSNPV